MAGDYYERVTQINGPTQTMEASCFSTNTTIVRKAVGNGNKVALHITYIEDCCLSLNPLCRDKVIARKKKTFTAGEDQMSVEVWGQGRLANETYSCVYRRLR